MPFLDQRHPENKNDRRQGERRQCIFINGRRNGPDRSGLPEMIKYFHELRDEEHDWLVAEGTTYSELERDFPAPIWCKYYQATYGPMGCWSLVDKRIKSINDCQNCELCKVEP